MLGEFTHKKEEMMLERDLNGLGTLAVHCGVYVAKRGYQATALSAKNMLKDLCWSVPFKSLLESLLDARPKSLREVSISLRSLPDPVALPVPVVLPALNLSEVSSKSPTAPLSSDRFVPASSRGDSGRDAAVPSAITAIAGSIHLQKSRVMDRPPETHRTEPSVRKEQTAINTQTGGEHQQFKFSKGYDIPIELQDEEDIDYSQASIQPSQHSRDLGNRSKVFLDQPFHTPSDLSSVRSSNQSFVPRNEAFWPGGEDSAYQSEAELSQFQV